MLDLFAPSSGSMLVIGIGSLGGRVSSAGAANTDGDFKALWSVVHTNPAELIATGLEKKLLLNVKEGPFASRSAATVVEDNSEILSHWTSGKSVVFLIGNSSERPTELLLAPIATSLRSAKDVMICAVLCEDPFASDLKSDDTEVSAFENLECDLLIRVPVQSAERAQLEKPATVLRAETEQRLLRVIETIGGALASEIQGTGFGASEFKRALSGVGALKISITSGQGKRAVVEAAEAAFAKHEPASAEGLATMLMLGREVSAAEMKSLNEMMQRPPRAASALLGVSVQPALEDEVFCVVLSRVAGSRNVVKLERAVRRAAVTSDM